MIFIEKLQGFEVDIFIEKLLVKNLYVQIYFGNSGKFCKKLHETQGSQANFHGIRYINLMYIYLLLYNSSILDIEHFPYYIALGLPQTHKVI